MNSFSKKRILELYFITRNEVVIFIFLINLDFNIIEVVIMIILVVWTIFSWTTLPIEFSFIKFIIFYWNKRCWRILFFNWANIIVLSNDISQQKKHSQKSYNIYSHSPLIFLDIMIDKRCLLIPYIWFLYYHVTYK